MTIELSNKVVLRTHNLVGDYHKRAEWFGRLVDRYELKTVFDLHNALCGYDVIELPNHTGYSVLFNSEEEMTLFLLKFT